MDWNSLFSGFIGSLVGAGITAIVVYYTTRWGKLGDVVENLHFL